MLNVDCIYSKIISTSGIKSIHHIACTNINRTRCTHGHSSSSSERTRERWVPRFLWMPEHSMQMSAPRLRLAHSGSEKELFWINDQIDKKMWKIKSNFGLLHWSQRKQKQSMQYKNNQERMSTLKQLKSSLLTCSWTIGTLGVAGDRT